MAYLSVSIVFLIGLSTAWCVTIETEEKVVIKEAGESVTLECVAEGSGVFIIYPMTWHKIQGEEESQMLNNGQQSEPFTGERFPAPDISESVPAINPQILSLRVEDSGKYKCSVDDQSITHELWVLDPIESLTLWGYPNVNLPQDMEASAAGEQLMFEVGMKGYVECRAAGGIPPPTLRLIDSSNDRTIDGGETEHEVNITGGERGMRKLHYTTYIKHDQFELEQKSDGHKLRCEASVEDEVETTEKTISLTYLPFIMDGDCEEVHYAPLGKDRKITCMFYAKPAANKVYWFNQANGMNIDAEIEQVGDYKYAINLKLEEVSVSDFTKYELRVENTVGNLQFEIEVKEGEVEIDGEVSDGNAASSLWPHALLMLISLALVFLQRS